MRACVAVVWGHHRSREVGGIKERHPRIVCICHTCMQTDAFVVDGCWDGETVALLNRLPPFIVINNQPIASMTMKTPPLQHRDCPQLTKLCSCSPRKTPAPQSNRPWQNQADQANQGQPRQKPKPSYSPLCVSSSRPEQPTTRTRNTTTHDSPYKNTWRTSIMPQS